MSISNAIDFINAAKSDRLWEAEMTRAGEKYDWDWKELAGAKYRLLCEFGESIGIDPEAEFGMPDGDNCPRAFREWWEENTQPVRDRMNAADAAAELAEYGGNPYVHIAV